MLVSVSVKVLLKGCEFRTFLCVYLCACRSKRLTSGLRPLKGVESKVEVGRDTEEAEESDEQSLFVGEDGHDPNEKDGIWCSMFTRMGEWV